MYRFVIRMNQQAILNLPAVMSFKANSTFSSRTSPGAILFTVSLIAQHFSQAPGIVPLMNYDCTLAKPKISAIGIFISENGSQSEIGQIRILSFRKSSTP